MIADKVYLVLQWHDGRQLQFYKLFYTQEQAVLYIERKQKEDARYSYTYTVQRMDVCEK